MDTEEIYAAIESIIEVWVLSLTDPSLPKILQLFTDAWTLDKVWT